MAKGDSVSRAKEILGSIDRHKTAAQKQKEKERRDMILGIGKEVAGVLKPTLDQLASQARMTKADMADFVSKIKVETHTPDVVLPKIDVPKAEVTVRSPKIRVPDVIMPDEMNVRGWVQLQGVDLNNPLPVQLRTADGSPFELAERITQIVSGGGSMPRIMKISDILTSTGSLIDDQEGALKVTGSLDATLSADTGSGEIASETLRIVQATDAISSVNVVGFDSTVSSYLVDGDGNYRDVVPVSIESGASSGTEYEDGATAEPSTGSVIMGDTGEESGNVWALATHSGVTGSSVLRVVHAADVGVSTSASQAGTWNIGTVSTVTDVTNSVSVYNLDADGNYRDVMPVDATGAGDVPVTLDGETVTVTATNLDVQSGGSDLATSSQGSAIQTAVEIMDDWDATHDSAASTDGAQVMGEARTTNPTAVGDGDAVRLRTDDLGRQLTRPIQVRDLVATAYATISTDAETTLLSGSASTFHDLVYVMGANHSDGAATLDLYTGSGGAVMMSLEVPANSTAGVSPTIPIPMTEAAQAWYVNWADSDVTGTTVDVTASFSKEV